MLPVFWSYIAMLATHGVEVMWVPSHDKKPLWTPVLDWKPFRSRVQNVERVG